MSNFWGAVQVIFPLTFAIFAQIDKFCIKMLSEQI